MGAPLPCLAMQLLCQTQRKPAMMGLCLPEIHRHRRSHPPPSSLVTKHSAGTAPKPGMFSLPGTQYWSCDQESKEQYEPSVASLQSSCCLCLPARAILLCCLYTGECGKVGGMEQAQRETQEFQIRASKSVWPVLVISNLYQSPILSLADC